MSGLVQKLKKSSRRQDDNVSNVILAKGERGSFTGLESGFRFFASSDSIEENKDAWDQQAAELAAVDDCPPQVRSLIKTTAEKILCLADEQRDEIVSEMRGFLGEVAAELEIESAITSYDLSYSESSIWSLLVGLGPLSSLLGDTGISHIFIDSFDRISVKVGGSIRSTELKFGSPGELSLLVDALERRATDVQSAPDGSRTFFSKVSRTEELIFISSLGGDEKLCLHLPRARQITFYDLLKKKAIPVSLASWLGDLSVDSASNVLVCSKDPEARQWMLSSYLSATPSEQRVLLRDKQRKFELAIPDYETISGAGDSNPQDVIEAVSARSPNRLGFNDLGVNDSSAFLRLIESDFSGSIASISASNAREGLWKLVDLVQASSFSSDRSLIRRVSRSIRVVISLIPSAEGFILDKILELMPSDGDDFCVRELVSREKGIWVFRDYSEGVYSELRETQGAVFQSAEDFLPVLIEAEEGAKVE